MYVVYKMSHIIHALFYIGFVDAFVNSDRTSIDGFLNFTAPQPFEGFVSFMSILLINMFHYIRESVDSLCRDGADACIT